MVAVQHQDPPLLAGLHHNVRVRSLLVRHHQDAARTLVRVAIRYYAEFPDEVDRLIAANEHEAAQLEQALEKEQRLLG